MSRGTTPSRETAASAARRNTPGRGGDGPVNWQEAVHGYVWSSDADGNVSS